MTASEIEKFCRLVKSPVRTQVPLASYSSFRIGGPAAIFAEPRNSEELKSLFEIINGDSLPYFFLGHGSNILISDDGFDGIVIRPAGELCRIEVKNDFVMSGPGARLLLLTTIAASHSLSGMEPLSGIPGSVGGGLFMNAGAYGGEISDTLVDVTVLNSRGSFEVLTKSEIGFSYRIAPAFQDKIILNSRYRLTKSEANSIYSEMQRVWTLRREKQPIDFPSAGSMFKRPPGDFAGRLIEAVEGKSARIGDAMVSPKHAGIFINAGRATAKDVAALVRDIRKRVYLKFNILLENEVKPIGFHEDPFAIQI